MCCAAWPCWSAPRCAPTIISRTPRVCPSPISASRSPAATSPICPPPKPYREIFIWSPQVEGVHLRVRAGGAGGACVGATGATTSAPRCWVWPRRSRSRTR
ncbi:MAG: NAD-glutamate dehydrogenase domain-containing protein [Caulobacteraceae bacterium]